MTVREIISVRCAVCRDAQSGEEKDNVLIRGEKPVAWKCGDYWLCARHKDLKPLNVKIGDRIWERVGHFDTGRLVLYEIVKVTARTFSTRSSNYNVFGAKISGPGPYAARLVDASILSEFNAQQESEKSLREENTRKAELRQSANVRRVAKFRDMLPAHIRDDAAIFVENEYDGKVTLNVTVNDSELQ